MEFTFNTQYSGKILTDMSKVMRKTARKKKSRRSMIFGIAVIILALLLIIPSENQPFVLDAKTILNISAVLIILFSLAFQDKLNGYFAGKKILRNANICQSVFTSENYINTTDAAQTKFEYKNIEYIGETENCFVFILDKTYAQAFDKNTLSGGSLEDFRQFITQITDKTIQKI